MPRYAILTNRKRAIIALVHSVFFLLIAVIQLPSYMPPARIHIHTAYVATFALLTIYFLVSAVLLILTWFSCCSLERLYFALCSTSASAGLFRTLFGDPPLHLAGILRVLMLGLAGLTGFIILREHTEPSGNLEIG